MREYDPILSENSYLTEKIANWREYIEEKEDIGVIAAVRSVPPASLLA